MKMKTHTLTPENARLELWQRMARPIKTNNTFTMTAEYDKQFTTYRTKFTNDINFHNFPHIPNNDFVITRANENPNDNNKRN
jgi:Uncharacterized conserved protein